MAEDDKDSRLHIVDSPSKPNGAPKTEEQKYEVVGVPLLKENFATLFDNQEDVNVMIFTIPIRALATDPGKDSLALLLGKIELLKGEAHKFYKAIKADNATRGPQLLRPGGGTLPPLARA